MARSPRTVDQLVELKDLALAYAKQETVDPLRSVGRQVGFGIGGSILVGLGSFFLLLALLRGLQSVDTFKPDHVTPGAMTLIPYAATIGAGLLIAAMVGWRISRSLAKPRRAGS